MMAMTITKKVFISDATKSSRSWAALGKLERNRANRNGPRRARQRGHSALVRIARHYSAAGAGFKREKGAPNQNGEPRAKLRLGKLDRQMAQAMIAGDRARRRISLLLEHLLTSGKSTVSMRR
jgi:hypothetical protein